MDTVHKSMDFLRRLNSLFSWKLREKAVNHEEISKYQIVGKILHESWKEIYGKIHGREIGKWYLALVQRRFS